jgi:Pyruvate/2-oxoacid:ferredoxin oxidoreductase delta subunit
MEYFYLSFFLLLPSLVGHISDEGSGVRKLFLKAYAWKEVELLKILFVVSRFGIMKRAWFRKPFYYLFAHFLGTRGVVCQAATLDETYRFIDGLSDEHKIAVGPCRCRVGNRNCDHEILTDIVIKETGKIWYDDLFPDDYRIITKEEAKDICKKSRDAQMIQCIDRHMYFRGSENYFVICNCCKESCVPIIAYRLFKEEPYAFFPSTFVAAVDENKCTACGICVSVCPFEERELSEDKDISVVLQCQGCGLCADRCPSGAVTMIPREESSLASVKPW